VRQRRRKAAGGSHQRLHIISGYGAGASRLLAKNLPRRFDFRGGDQKPVLEKGARRLCASAMMRYRLLPDGELKPAWRAAAMLSPVAKSLSADRLNDPGGLPQVVKLLAVNDVRLRRASRSCFGFRFHPPTVAQRQRKITQKISRFLKALPAYLVAPARPGAVL
jgi:hypothetical protein